MVGVKINSEETLNKGNNDLLDPFDKKSNNKSTDTNCNSKNETSGFFKHFEDFFNVFRKNIKKREQTTPRTLPVDLSLGTAVNSLIHETSTKTAIIGPRGVGKSYLVNTLLETSAPSEKDYVEQRTAARFVEQAYKKTIEPSPTTDKPKEYRPLTSAAKPTETSRSAPYGSTTGAGTSAYGLDYSFETPQQVAAPIKAYGASTVYDFDQVEAEVPTEPMCYTESTGYSFDQADASVDDLEFQWEIGHIEQTLVPDDKYGSTIQWEKERQIGQTKPDDLHDFLIPQAIHSVQPHCFELRYGKVPELIITFVDETKLRSELWEVHEIEAGTRKLHSFSQKSLMEARYRNVLGLKKEQKIPLGHIKSSNEFKIPTDIQKLLGKSYRFRGLGKDFHLDRIYIREKLKEIVQNYSFFTSNLLLRMPCGILEGQRELVEVSSVDVLTPKTTQTIGTSNLLIVLLDKRGITRDLSEILRISGFLEKSLRSPQQHKIVFVEIGDHIQKQYLSQLADPRHKSEFENYRHSVLLQFKLVLNEQTANWSAVDKVVGASTVLNVCPRLYSLLHGAGDSIPTELLGGLTQLEALSSTSVPALAGSVANMTVSKCAESLLEMNQEWMQKLAMTATPSFSTTTTTTTTTTQSTPEDPQTDNITSMLDQLTLSFHHKFDRLRNDLAHHIETLDSVLVHKAKESFEACRTNMKKEGTVLLSAYVNQLMSGPLTQAAPVAWNENIAQTVPKKIEDLLQYSAKILQECVNLVEKSDDAMEKARLRTLVQFCQGTHARAVKRLEEFKKQLQIDTVQIVQDACTDALQSSLSRQNSTPQDLSVTFPEISMNAAKNIREKFSQKLKTDMRHLDIMEKDLERALKSIMVVLKAKPTSSVLKNDLKHKMKQINVDFPSKKTDSLSTFEMPPTYNPSKKLTDEENLMLSSVSSPKVPMNFPRELREPMVYTAFDTVDTSRLFNKQAWLQYDSMETTRTIRFEEQLKKSNLSVIEVKKDKSCQFRSLAHQVYGTEDAHSIIRLLLVSELLTNSSLYEKFLSMKGTNLQEYVSRVAKETEMGDHLTLCAFANFYGSDLLLYSPIFTHPLLIQSRNPYTNRTFSISYIQENVYQSLIATTRETMETNEKTMLLSPGPPSSPVAMETVEPAKRRLQVSSLMDVEEQHNEKSLRVGGISVARRYSPLSLTDLCLAKITQYVDMIPCLDGSLPEELTQKLIHNLLIDRKVDDSVLQRLLDFNIRNLDLEGCTALTDLSVRHIARTCDQLKSLNLSGCINIGNDSLIQIALHCRELEMLNIAHCSSVSNAGLQEISRKCKNILWVDITACTKITDVAINELTLACGKLRTLITKDVNKLTDQAFRYLGNQMGFVDISGCDVTDAGVANLAKCSELSTVRISSKNVTDKSIMLLGENCKKLRFVDLSGCELVTDVSIQVLSNNCPIDSLFLACCKLISNESFTEMTKVLPQITTLDLSRCLNINDAAVTIISKHCENLETINLSSCEDITDDCIVQLARRCKKLKDVSLSKCMNLSDVSVIELSSHLGSSLTRLVLYNCHRLTDQSILQLSQRCPDLRDLDLSSCQGLTDESIVSLMASCPYIEALGLEECPITEVSINAIGENGFSLKTLKLAYCKGVTDASLGKLAAGCPRLGYLDLSYCTVSLTAIKSALGNWPYLSFLSLRGFAQLNTETFAHSNLRELNLSWCKNLQDAAIDQLSNGCPNLVHLDLAWASKITANSVHKLAQRLRSLRLLNLRGCTNVAVLTLKYLAGGNVTIYN